MQHSSDHDGHDYMQLLFGKIHVYKMGIGTCIRREYQDHEVAKVIQEDQWS